MPTLLLIWGILELFLSHPTLLPKDRADDCHCVRLGLLYPSYHPKKRYRHPGIRAPLTVCYRIPVREFLNLIYGRWVGQYLLWPGVDYLYISNAPVQSFALWSFPTFRRLLRLSVSLLLGTALHPFQGVFPDNKLQRFQFYFHWTGYRWFASILFFWSFLFWIPCDPIQFLQRWSPDTVMKM